MAKAKDTSKESTSDKKEFKDILFEQFNKEFPDSPLEHMDESELANIPGWITTGNYALNWIISKSMFKGLPMGRISIFSGDPATGKSMIALSMMREPGIDTIIYFDSEGGGVTTDFATLLGIDPKKVLYAQVETIEELTAKMRFLIDTMEKNKTSKNVYMVVDSISMVSTDKEKDPEAGADMGNRGKVMRSFFRQYARKMQKLNICAVFTAHLTKNIGGYGPSEVVSGGTILGYAPTMEVRFSVDNQNSEVEKSARGATMQKLKATIIKSRLGTKGKQVKFEVENNKGINPYSGIFDILRDYQFIIPVSADVEKQIADKFIPKKSTGWWMFKPWEGTGKGEDEKTSAITVEFYNRFIKEGLTSDTGKFREGDIVEYCKNYDWFLIEIERLLDTIDEEDTETFASVEAQKTKDDSDDSEKAPADAPSVSITEVN